MTTRQPTPSGGLARLGQTGLLMIALLLGAAAVIGVAPDVLGQNGAGEEAAPLAQSAAACDVGAPEGGAAPFARTELFFGTSKPDGGSVSEADWRAFLDGEITPRFPDGLTVLTGFGQWQEADADIVQERSKLVILLYPRELATESGAKIEAIRAAYERLFQQESVLRADDGLPVCTSF